MRARYTLSFLLLSWLLGRSPLAAQNVQVKSAVPNVAAQGTINLSVSVGGRGFKNGAQAQWFVTGTTNPGGVTVNSTTVVSSTQLTANITVGSSATISSFDIAVTNKNGSSGKRNWIVQCERQRGPRVLALAPAQPVHPDGNSERQRSDLHRRAGDGSSCPAYDPGRAGCASGRRRVRQHRRPADLLRRSFDRRRSGWNRHRNEQYAAAAHFQGNLSERNTDRGAGDGHGRRQRGRRARHRGGIGYSRCGLCIRGQRRREWHSQLFR